MHYKEYKTIISPKGGMNIFRGCTHGCIYCDSRSSCYQINHPFEDIEIKTNAPQILEKQLRSKRNRGMIFTGSMCDPYVPLESEIKYTRQCTEVINRLGFGLSVLTKSDLILRDLDLLCSINKKAKCVVAMTLTTFDEKLCRIIEPNVCTTKERFEVLRIMNENGIPTVVWLCPILPFINDTAENLSGILDYCKRAKVYGILNFGMGVTLREGDREYFYAQLDKSFPNIKQKYISTYGSSYQVNSLNSKELNAIFFNECKQNDIVCDNGRIFDFLQALPDEQMTFLD